jgi:hypothetical protein
MIMKDENADESAYSREYKSRGRSKGEVQAKEEE